MSQVAANPFSHSGVLSQGNALYTGALSPLTGVNLPAQARPGMTIAGKRERMYGLIPMAPGSRHTVVIKAPDGEQTIGREKMVALKTAMRKAQAAEGEAMNAQINDPSEANTKAYLAAQSRSAAALSVWSVASARGSKPTQVHLLTAQDPSAVPEAFGDEEHLPKWICTHDGCRGQRWDSEREMRAAHPTPAVMRSGGAVHVCGLYSEAPMDPMDPEGGTVGLIAPVGADGMTAAQVAHAYLTGQHVQTGAEPAPPQEIPRPERRDERKG